MVCVICSSGINRPAGCPSLRPLSVLLTCLPVSFPHPLSFFCSSRGNSLCGVYFCMFVCLCLLHSNNNSWIWFVLLNIVMVNKITVRHTYRDRSVGKVYLGVMRHKAHVKLDCEFTYVGIIFYIKVIFFYIATNGGSHLETERDREQAPHCDPY